MINRFNKRRVFNNQEDLYEKIIDDRNLNLIRQYETPSYYVPLIDEYKKISTVEHIWSIGDRYYKLAYEYYGDVNDWWLIARFNNRPTESHNKIGDIILIPTRIEQVKALFKL